MKKKGRGPSRYTHISEILSGLVKNIRRESDSELSRIRHIWDQIVDPAITESAQPAALKDDILLVHAASSTIAHQLRFLFPQIIEQLNRVIGKQRISRIECKVGRVDGKQADG